MTMSMTPPTTPQATHHDGSPCSRRGEARRQAILDAAFAVFLEKGFERASLADILALSGGSRSTLYDLFGDKQSLFETVMLEGTRQFLAGFDAALGEAEQPPEQGLLRLGIVFLEALYSPQCQAIHRIVMAEGPHFPKVAEAFYRHGPRLVRDYLADYFVTLGGRGQLTVGDPIGAAEIFLGMVAGHNPFRAAAAMVMTPERREAHVAHAVSIFLHGVAGGTPV
jgi:AcrR family transcriptional regulator